METEKKWCVYVYYQPYDESVMATTADEAELLVTKNLYVGRCGEVSEVVVKRECEECRWEYDEDEAECWCGAKL